MINACIERNDEGEVTSTFFFTVDTEEEAPLTFTVNHND